MKWTFLTFVALAVAWHIITCGTAQAQGSFRADLGQQQPGPVWLYGGFGLFTSDAEAVQFNVNIVNPFDGTSFDPVIFTPSGTSSFSLGTGAPVRIPLGTFGDFMEGTQYVGSFSCPFAVLSDLFAGLGEFRLSSSSGVLLTGAILSVPEPSVCALFLFGLVAVCWTMRRVHENSES